MVLTRNEDRSLGNGHMSGWTWRSPSAFFFCLSCECWTCLSLQTCALWIFDVMNDDIYVDPTPTCRVCFDLGSNTFWIEACKRGEITVSELRDSAARGCVGCSILFRILNEAKRECFRWSIPLHYNSNCALQIGDVRIQVYNLPGMCAAIVYSPLLHITEHD